MAAPTPEADLAKPAARVRPFAAAFLAPVGDGSRRRSGTDVARLIAAVSIQRLFTGYLPPVSGWFAMMWMRRKELL